MFFDFFPSVRWKPKLVFFQALKVNQDKILLDPFFYLSRPPPNGFVRARKKGPEKEIWSEGCKQFATPCKNKTWIIKAKRKVADHIENSRKKSFSQKISKNLLRNVFYTVTNFHDKQGKNHAKNMKSKVRRRGLQVNSYSSNPWDIMRTPSFSD